MKFKSDIEVQAGLKDSSGSAGASGQLLSSTISGTSWINPPAVPGSGGSSQVFYFNGGTASSVVGYQQMSIVANTGTAADFSINANGYIASFLTDVASPNQLNIPAGNWNFEIYMNASSGGGSPSFYVELYKYSSSTFTLIASSSATPEGITNGTAIDLYTTALAVPATALLATDRLAVRVYVTHSGRTITMHTQNGHLSEVITTFSTGLTALNGLTAQVQYFAVGTAGTDFGISSATNTHTFNLPTASAINRGALSSADWTTFNSKANASGTTNYVSKFTGSTSLGDSSIFDNGNLVGINTSGSSYVTGGRGILSLNGASNSLMEFQTGGGSRSYFYQSGTSFEIYETTLLTMAVNGSERMRINSSGNVGIGVTVPETKLHIEDVTKVLTNNVAGVAQGTLSLVSTDAQAADIGASLLFGGNYITGSQTRIAYAAITGRKANSSSVNADGYLSFLTWRSTGLTEAMRVTPAGYLGINTTTPAKLLDVNGDALINTLTVGKGAGNQIYNTVLGYQALVNNTTGNDNVAIGYQTLLYNSTGNRNTGIGVATLKLNETGEDNTAVGAVALFNNTTGNGNTAIGYSALNASVDGYANTNIGSACGGLASSPIGTTLIGYDLKYRPSNLSDPLSDSDFAISQYWNEYPGKPHFYAPNKIAIGASANTEILSVSWDAYNAFFVDYSFDDGGGNLRAGTIKCIFASVSGTFYYELTDDVTPDIGTTTNLSFDVIDDGSHNAVLRVINSDAATYIRFTSRLLFKTI